MSSGGQGVYAPDKRSGSFEEIREASPRGYLPFLKTSLQPHFLPILCTRFSPLQPSNSSMDQEKGSFAGLKAFLKEEVQPQHADLLLLSCCLTSGLIDSTIYNGANRSGPPGGVTNLYSLQYIRINANR